MNYQLIQIHCKTPMAMLLAFFVAIVGLSVGTTRTAIAQQKSSIELEAILKLQVKGEVGQLRAVPVSLGAEQRSGFLVIHSSDAEIDPYIGMFFFPRDTLKMTMFSTNGDRLWQHDLGPGVVPGIWFCPVFSFDIDADGQDEIWYVGNSAPEHPMNYYKYRLVCLDGRTGEPKGTWPWPYSKGPSQSISHTYRNFIMGGFVRGEPVLVTGQGTYGRMALQGWNADMSRRWKLAFDPKKDGRAKGSHVSPVVDLDGDGVDELLWGERVIDLDSGTEKFCADEGRWNDHSDVVLPVLLRDSGKWQIYTCRERKMREPPRIVMYDDLGNRMWTALEHGHIDTGWAAHFGRQGKPMVLGVRIGNKVRDATGERRLQTESFLFHAKSGTQVNLAWDPYTTMPVDLDGDGSHELVKGYFEGNGDVFDHTGNRIGNVGGLVAMCSKFIDRPGEQILSYDRKGNVTVWADKNAVDRPAALARYAHPFYYANQRMTACGYNLFNLGGL